MQGDEPHGSKPGRIILIVEDNELNLKLLKDILDFRGYTTVVTGLGAAALDLARQHHPNLILLDIQLPDIPGEEVAQRLKADEQTCGIPIIAVTAFAMSGDRKRSSIAGVMNTSLSHLMFARFLRWLNVIQTQSQVNLFDPLGSTPERRAERP